MAPPPYYSEAYPPGLLDTPPQVEGEPQAPLFEDDSWKLAIELAKTGAYIVTAGPSSGKSALLREVEIKADQLWADSTLFIDVDEVGMSPESLKEAHKKIVDFQTTHGEDGAVFIDHIDSLLVRGDNTELNDGRDGIMKTILDLAAQRKGRAAICLATQGRQSESRELIQQFGDEKVYEFRGAITDQTAQELLAGHLATESVADIVNRPPDEAGWTYSAVQEVIRRASLALQARLPVPEETPFKRQMRAAVVAYEADGLAPNTRAKVVDQIVYSQLAELIATGYLSSKAE